MLLSTVEEISSINHGNVTALNLKIFIFKYRWWTCKITNDYIAVCIAIFIIVNACMCVYVCVHIYTYVLTHQYISFLSEINNWTDITLFLKIKNDQK